MTTSKGYQTKEKIIATAARLFLTKGYHATGINELLAKADVPKGSFYFHFASKKELASKVAEYYSNRLEHWIKQTAQGKNWAEFISALVEDMKVVADQGRHLGCPLGVLGVEIAFVEPALATEYARAMDRLVVIFTEVLERSELAPAEAATVARRAFALYQGHLQYYRMTKQVEVFDRILWDLISIYKQHLKPC
ncbi:MAG: TetR/AcrR family transcriptional regulator [Clostridia bacterium]|nr:TetR/AcrR family transcriptional regulator [Clostridia bacterium]